MQGICRGNWSDVALIVYAVAIATALGWFG